MVVFTGELKQLTRSQAQALVRSHGGSVGSSVTQKTTLVIAGKAAGSKAEKAKALGVKIVSEAEFMKVVKGGG